MRLRNNVFWRLPKWDAARKTSKTIWWQPFVLAGVSAFSSDLFRCMTRVSETKQLEWFQTWSLDVTGRSLFVHLGGGSCGLEWCTHFLQDGDPSESLFCSGSGKNQRIVHLRPSNCRNCRTAQQISKSMKINKAYWGYWFNSLGGKKKRTWEMGKNMYFPCSLIWSGKGTSSRIVRCSLLQPSKLRIPGWTKNRTAQIWSCTKTIPNNYDTIRNILSSSSKQQCWWQNASQAYLKNTCCTCYLQRHLESS